MIVLLTASSLYSSGCPLAPGVRDAGVAAGASSGGGAAAMTTTMTITGMTCGGCVAKVEERLGRAVGVAGYEVSLETGEARVSYEPAATTPEAIAAAISETGLAAAVKERPAP
jgi:copper chaperone CopZ